MKFGHLEGNVALLMTVVEAPRMWRSKQHRRPASARRKGLMTMAVEDTSKKWPLQILMEFLPLTTWQGNTCLYQKNTFELFLVSMLGKFLF